MSAKRTVRHPYKYSRVDPEHTVEDSGMYGYDTRAPLTVKSSLCGAVAQSRIRMRWDCNQYTGTEYTGLDERG